MAVLALIGSLLGLTVGRQVGGVEGIETGLIASAGVYAIFLFVMLASRPFQSQTWIAPLTSAFFVAYLSLAGLISVGDDNILDSFFVYLLWFFPLLVFNRFVNVSNYSQVFSYLFIGLALALAATRIVVHPDDAQGVIMMVVYALSLVSFVLLLELFARFREGWIQEQERERGRLLVDQALREREQRFRRLFANAAAGIGWLSLEGECLDINRTFGEIVGIPHADMRGSRFGEFVDAADYDRWQALRESLSSLREEDVTVELRLRGSGGRAVVAGLSFSLVRDPDGEPEAIAFVCLDNSRVRAMED